MFLEGCRCDRSSTTNRSSSDRSCGWWWTPLVASMAHMSLGSPVILGFDIRSFIASSATWTRDRRLRFLIRPDIPVPLSVDRGVWPAIVRPPDQANPLELWNSLESAERLLSSGQSIDASAGAAILIEIAVLPNEREVSYWRQITFGCGVQEKTDQEDFFEDLGFDVADRYLLSGLSNCAHPSERISALRLEWSSRVNSFGLISNPRWAGEFVSIVDRLVPEHAPFFVYRLRRIASSFALNTMVECKRRTNPRGQPRF